MLIFLRPEYDFPTRYTARWAKKLVDLARDKGYSPVDLGPKRANRKTIESFLRKKKAFFVMFNGHGGPDRVYGQDNEILVKAADNERLLKSVVVYSLTCNSAKVLGPSATRAGAVAYIGYISSFWFTYKRSEASHPLRDKRARPFFEAAHHIVVALLKGHTVWDSVIKSKEKFKTFSQRMMTSEATDDDLLDASLLRYDMLNQSYSGDGEAKLPK